MNTETPPPKKIELQNPNASPMVPQGGMPQPPWMPGYPVADEIDLVDLGVMLWRRWRLMAWVAGALMVLVILVAIFKSPSYEYSTTLKLGTVASQSGGLIPLIPPASVVQALQSTYIPNAIDQYATENHTDTSSLKVDVNTSSTNDNSTITIQCKAKATKAQECITVEKVAAEAFLNDNSQTTLAAQNTLASLQAQARVLQVNADKLKTSITLYQQQALELQKHIATVRKTDIESAKGTIKPADALSSLLLSTQVQQSVDQLNRIQQDLDVSLPGKQAALAKQIADNERDQQLQTQIIAQNTNHILSAGMRSLKPVGLGRSAIVALGIVLAFFLAVVAALFANYVKQVRERLALAQSAGQ